jgi:GTP-binding protein HflX
MQALHCQTLIVDTELSPSQQHSIENAFAALKVEFKVLDRAALILDIFAQHARTSEGQLQVDLALLTYRLPRLTRMWTHLERQSSAGYIQ